MNNRTKQFFRYALFILAASAVPLPAFACLCVEKPLEEQFDNASIVFSGWKLESKQQGYQKFLNVPVYETKFLVIRTFKGQLPNEITIRHTKNGSTCGRDFEFGARIIIAAGGDPETARTSMCTMFGVNGEPESDWVELLEELSKDN